MSSADGLDGPEPANSDNPEGRQRPSLGTLLFETLCYLLIEKGVLTKNDALSIVQTVAQVKTGSTGTDPDDAETEAGMRLLRRMFASFEALDTQPNDIDFAGGNVHRLRPPVQAGRAEFPEAG